MKQIMMTCLVDMPDDLFEASGVAIRVKPAWEVLLKALRDANVKHSTKAEVVEAGRPLRQASSPRRPRKSIGEAEIPDAAA